MQVRRGKEGSTSRRRLTTASELSSRSASGSHTADGSSSWTRTAVLTAARQHARVHSSASRGTGHQAGTAASSMWRSPAQGGALVGSPSAASLTRSAIDEEIALRLRGDGTLLPSHLTYHPANVGTGGGNSRGGEAASGGGVMSLAKHGRGEEWSLHRRIARPGGATAGSLTVRGHETGSSNVSGSRSSFAELRNSEGWRRRGRTPQRGEGGSGDKLNFLADDETGGCGKKLASAGRLGGRQQLGDDPLLPSCSSSQRLMLRGAYGMSTSGMSSAATMRGRRETAQLADGSAWYGREESIESSESPDLLAMAMKDVGEDSGDEGSPGDCALLRPLCGGEGGEGDVRRPSVILSGRRSSYEEDLTIAPRQLVELQTLDEQSADGDEIFGSESIHESHGTVSQRNCGSSWGGSVRGSQKMVKSSTGRKLSVRSKGTVGGRSACGLDGSLGASRKLSTATSASVASARSGHGKVKTPSGSSFGGAPTTAGDSWSLISFGSQINDGGGTSVGSAASTGLRPCWYLVKEDVVSNKQLQRTLRVKVYEDSHGGGGPRAKTQISITARTLSAQAAKLSSSWTGHSNPKPGPSGGDMLSDSAGDAEPSGNLSARIGSGERDAESVVLLIEHAHKIASREIAAEKDLLFAAVVAQVALPIEVSHAARRQFEQKHKAAVFVHDYMRKLLTKCSSGKHAEAAGIRLFWWRPVGCGMIVVHNCRTGRVFGVMNQELSLSGAATCLSNTLKRLRGSQLPHNFLDVHEDFPHALKVREEIMSDSQLSLAHSAKGEICVEATTPEEVLKSEVACLDDMVALVRAWSVKDGVEPIKTEWIIKCGGSAKGESLRYSLDIDFAGGQSSRVTDNMGGKRSATRNRYHAHHHRHYLTPPVVAFEPAPIHLQVHRHAPLVTGHKLTPMCMTRNTPSSRAFIDIRVAYRQALWLLQRLYRIHSSAMSESGTVATHQAQQPPSTTRAAAPSTKTGGQSFGLEQQALQTSATVNQNVRSVRVASRQPTLLQKANSTGLERSVAVSRNLQSVVTSSSATKETPLGSGTRAGASPLSGNSKTPSNDQGTRRKGAKKHPATPTSTTTSTSASKSCSASAEPYDPFRRTDTPPSREQESRRGGASSYHQHKTTAFLNLSGGLPSDGQQP